MTAPEMTHIHTTAGELQPGDTWKKVINPASYIQSPRYNVIEVLSVEDNGYSRVDGRPMVIVTTRRQSDGRIQQYGYHADHPITVNRKDNT